MSQPRDMPLYNLKAVVRETGLKPDTLRAWERRYGLPEPTRTSSGHRLYAQQDIDMLRWLMARLDEGLNISRAIALWRELQRQGTDPLVTPPVGAGTAQDLSLPQTPYSSASVGDSDTMAALRGRWIADCLRFDEQAAEHTLSAAFAQFPVETVCIELIQRSLAHIGDGWYAGTITVQQEHFASELAMRRLEALLAATPAPTRPGRILVGCPPDEAHTFVPLLLTLLLRRRGWNVIFLGASIPLQSLELTVQATRPTLVILTAQQLHTAAGLLDMGQLLLSEGVPMAFGGLVFSTVPDLPLRVPGHFLGDDLGAAVSRIETILAAPSVQPASRLVSHEYRDALHHFQERRPRIEADVWKRLDSLGMPARHLSTGNAYLGRTIAAALALGSMDFMGPDLTWVEDVLVNHLQMPPQILKDYLEAYFAAATANLGLSGMPVLHWFEKTLGVSGGALTTNSSRLPTDGI